MYSSKVGIMGEGYGGFVSIYALTNGQSSVRCGIGVRPIINWSLYCKFFVNFGKSIDFI